MSHKAMMEEVVRLLSEKIGRKIPHYDFSNTYDVEKLNDLGSIKGYEEVISQVLDPLPPNHGILDTYVGPINDEMKKHIQKNSTKATELRNKGNNLYARSKSVDDFLQVFRTYNESIAIAPNNSRELALAYGNRAMVLFCCRYYNECLTDINRAVCLDYPDQSLGKLLVKKVRCLRILNHPDLHATYEDCLEWIDKHSTNVQEMKKQIKKAYEDRVTDSCLVPVNTRLRDDLLAHMKKSCPNLDKVQIKRNNKDKLILVAAKDIKLNEVIAIQKMYTQIFHVQEPYLACWQCVTMCLNPIPCDGCSKVMYCSESCKAEAWSKHHQFECPIIHMVTNAMPDYQLAIRICMIAMKQLGGILPLMKEVYKMSKSTDITQEHQIVNGMYPSDSYRSVYYMVNKYPATVVPGGCGTHVLKVCAFVSYLASRTTFFGQQYEGDMHTLMEERPLKFFAALIFRHHIMLREIHKTDWTLSNDTKMSMTPVCPLFHILNHNCNPSSVKLMLKDHEILVAIENIKEGQEICISYYPTILCGVECEERNSIINEILSDAGCECQVCIPEVLDVAIPGSMKKYDEPTQRDIQRVMKILNKAKFKLDAQNPKSAAQFMKQTTDLCKNCVQPIFDLLPGCGDRRCGCFVLHKEYLMNLYLNLHKNINSFLKN